MNREYINRYQLDDNSCKSAPRKKIDATGKKKREKRGKAQNN